MAPRYINKGIRGKWSDENMNNAVHAVNSGSMSVNKAANTFKVPRRTLRRYLAEGKTIKSRLGRKPLLSYEQEKELCNRIIRLCSVGYPLTSRVLRACVKRYCIANEVAISSQTQMIGRDWLKGFLKRNKNISQRKAQNLNPARAQKLNKFVVEDYFKKLKKILDDNDFLNRPEKIYNIDEKGCQLKLHKMPKVLGERGAKRIHLVAPEHAENVTVVSCGNALGQVIPPMLLFKGKRMKPEWVDSLPPGSVAQMTPKGSMNIEAFCNWLHHFARFKVEGPCLLIFDGAKCHLDDSIVEVANQHRIKLLCLPSNTTHELQPMDKTVFRSFEYYWDEEVLKYWSLHQDRVITKQRFGSIFSKVWDKALTPSNIKSGFEVTGIYPFDPSRIPIEAYAPSIPTLRSAPETSLRPSTQPSTSFGLAGHDPNIVSPNHNLSRIREKASSPSILTLQPGIIEICVSPQPSTSSGLAGHDPDIMSPNHNLSRIREEASTPSILKLQPAIDICLSPQPSTSSGLVEQDPNIMSPHPILSRIREEASTPTTLTLHPAPEICLSPQPSTSLGLTEYGCNIVAYDQSQLDYSNATRQDTEVCSEDDDDIPLSRLRQSHKRLRVNIPENINDIDDMHDRSFCQIMKTPIKVATTPSAPKRKAINSLAVELTLSVFSNKSKEKGKGKSKEKDKEKGKDKRKGTSNGKNKGKGRASNINVSWYCFICNEDRIADMRLCIKCASYVHEECVGLTLKDKENFICVKCDD